MLGLKKNWKRRRISCHTAVRSGGWDLSFFPIEKSRTQKLYTTLRPNNEKSRQTNDQATRSKNHADKLAKMQWWQSDRKDAHGKPEIRNALTHGNRFGVGQTASFDWLFVCFRDSIWDFRKTDDVLNLIHISDWLLVLWGSYMRSWKDGFSRCWGTRL